MPTACGCFAAPHRRNDNPNENDNLVRRFRPGTMGPTLTERIRGNPGWRWGGRIARFIAADGLGEVRLAVAGRFGLFPGEIT